MCVFFSDQRINRKGNRIDPVFIHIKIPPKIGNWTKMVFFEVIVQNEVLIIIQYLKSQKVHQDLKFRRIINNN